MAYVFYFVMPFVIAYLLAQAIGFWRALLTTVAVLLSFIGFAYFASSKLFEGVVMMSPFVIPFVVPIYLVGLFTGNCIHKRLAKKETKIDMTNDHISPMMNAEPSCSANPNSSESMSESMPTGYKISLKKITSPITTSILVLTFIAITFGITYDFKRDSIEGDAKKYLLNSKQVNDKTGHIKDVQSAFIARNAQSNRQRAVHVFYVQSERGNFTVLINVDGYVINPKFSLNEIRDGYMQIGEYLPV